VSVTDQSSAPSFLPELIDLPGKKIFFGSQRIPLSLASGLHVFVGPNGAGKTEVLKWLRDVLRGLAISLATRRSYSFRRAETANWNTSALPL
jgi:recombinational DNA repair ATPase RecF